MACQRKGLPENPVSCRQTATLMNRWNHLQVAIMFLSMAELFHEPIWANWFQDVEGLVPYSFLRSKDCPDDATNLNITGEEGGPVLHVLRSCLQLRYCGNLHASKALSTLTSSMVCRCHDWLLSSCIQCSFRTATTGLASAIPLQCVCAHSSKLHR